MGKLLVKRASWRGLDVNLLLSYFHPAFTPWLSLHQPDTKTFGLPLNHAYDRFILEPDIDSPRTEVKLLRHREGVSLSAQLECVAVQVRGHLGKVNQDGGNS